MAPGSIYIMEKAQGFMDVEQGRTYVAFLLCVPGLQMTHLGTFCFKYDPKPQIRASGDDSEGGGETEKDVRVSLKEIESG